MTVLDAFRLDGRVALVPGAGGAIGTAISLALADAGARIAAANHTLESAEACAAAVGAAGGEAIALQMDATDDADCERAVAEAVAAFGKVDLVVNCVGGGAGKVLFDAQAYPRDAWDWIMEINVRATVLPTEAAARAMIGAGTGGAVVNLSSVGAARTGGAVPHLGPVRAVRATRAGASPWAGVRGPAGPLPPGGPTEGPRHN